MFLQVSVDPDCRDDADPVITINHGHFTWTPETTDETTPTKKETTPTETKPTSSQDGESTLTDINLVIRPVRIHVCNALIKKNNYKINFTFFNLKKKQLLNFSG